MGVLGGGDDGTMVKMREREMRRGSMRTSITQNMILLIDKLEAQKPCRGSVAEFPRLFLAAAAPPFAGFSRKFCGASLAFQGGVVD